MTRFRKTWMSTALALIVMFTSSLFQTVSASATGQDNAHSDNTATPIKHVIVIIGENHTFDNIFGAFQPQNGQMKAFCRHLTRGVKLKVYSYILR